MNLKFLLLVTISIAMGSVAAPCHAQSETRNVAPLEDVSAVSPSPILSGLQGDWYYTLKLWKGPAAEPQISSGILKNKMVLDDKFLQSQTSIILNIDGESVPYESLGMIGYDVDQKTYTFVWADSLHANLMTGSGHYDEKLKAIELKSNFNKSSKNSADLYRTVIELTSEDAYKQTLFVGSSPKKEIKVMEIEFSRHSQP